MGRDKDSWTERKRKQTVTTTMLTERIYETHSEMQGATLTAQCPVYSWAATNFPSASSTALHRTWHHMVSNMPSVWPVWVSQPAYVLSWLPVRINPILAKPGQTYKYGKYFLSEWSYWKHILMNTGFFEKNGLPGQFYWFSLFHIHKAVFVTSGGLVLGLFFFYIWGGEVSFHPHGYHLVFSSTDFIQILIEIFSCKSFLKRIFSFLHKEDKCNCYLSSDSWHFVIQS